MRITCAVLLVVVVVAAAVVATAGAAHLRRPLAWQPSTKPRAATEAFAVQAEDQAALQAKRAAVVAMFQRLLGRAPSEYEVTLYREYVTDPADTQMLADYIRQTSEYKAKQQLQPQQQAAPAVAASAAPSDPAFPSKEKLELYRSIIDTYNRVLDRMPSSAELEFYFTRVTRAGLTLDGLRQLLEASNEYRILQKDQTNTVNAGLPGNVTDAQLVLDVREVYAGVHGAGVLPSQLLEDFLKAKYVEYSLSKPKLRSFLLLLRKLDGSGLETEGDVTAAVCGTGAATATTAVSSGAGAQPSQPQPQSSQAGGGAAAAGTEAKSGGGAAGAGGAQGAGAGAGGAQGGTAGSSTSSGGACGRSVWWDLRDQQYELLSSANGGKSGLPESAQQCTRTAPRDPYAEAVFGRNMSEVQYACNRVALGGGSRHHSSDALGTPIEDAMNTKIGSIMPRFTYKELTRDY